MGPPDGPRARGIPRVGALGGRGCHVWFATQRPPVAGGYAVLLILRIKRCESALDGGRLEEACELLRQPDVRAHRRGQELTDAAVVALVHRGREHLAAARLAAASEDARNAAILAGNTTDVAALHA